MSDDNVTIDQFDSWITEDSDVAALVMRQWLVPVEGEDAVVFPPTYAKPERIREEDWLGYNIDRFEDGTSICQIDSVGSQANRMEPIFKREECRHLVPQVVVRASVDGEDKEINLLDAGHRAADAIVRFSDLAEDLEKAFQALKDDGNAEPLAKIAPTSLVFGAWDSRATQVKVSRIVRSVIRAFQVKALHRSAQYIPPIDYVEESLLDPPEGKGQQDSMSELGLRHAPAPWTHGGIQVQGIDKENSGIRRDATLNLAALRALGGEPKSADATLALRRYILGLALVSFTAPQETFLREGCQLVPDTERDAEWSLVKHDGTREDSPIDHSTALAYAKLAADDFGVGPKRQGTFDSKTAREAVGQTKQERKASKRRGRKKSQKEES